MFRLVRIDGGLTPPPGSGLALAPGVHPFGRGVFLGCDDKRVSRRHGQLDVASSLVELKSLHHNPCFVIKKGNNETQVLKQGSSVALVPGDKFGLLPAAYWYELLLSDEPSADSSTEETVYSERVARGAQNEDDEELLGFDFDGDVQEATQRTDSPSLLAREIDQPQAPETSDGIVAAAAPPSADPGEMHTHTDETNTILSSFASRQAQNGNSTEDNSTATKRAAAPAGSDGSPAKLPRTSAAPPSPAPGEPADVKPSTSALDAAMASAVDAVIVKQEVKTEPPSLAQAPVAAAAPGRERCMYGAQCYRRNAQHKQAFSHPADGDWGCGERGVCPWGAGCTRRDPRHWRDHTHPPGAAPPPPGHARGTAITKRPKKKRRDSRSHSDSPDATRAVSPDVDPANVLPVKRRRKPVKRPSWSGSESENDYDLDDPFMTDGSEDEWLPETGNTPSDYTQSQ